MEAAGRISVIVPVYKVEAYLRQCLDSVIHQTYRNLEIILIDDGSPDGCGSICDEYARRDTRIRLLHKENGGLSRARNDGIRLAVGEWITFVDSDDWLSPDYYERMSAFLTDDEAEVVCSRGYIVESPGGSVTMRAFEGELPPEGEAGKIDLIHRVLVPRRQNGLSISAGTVWDKFFRASFLRRNRLLFDASSRAWEDLWFSLQAFNRAKRVKVAGEIGYHYRTVANSITKRFDLDRPRINYDFLCKIHSLEIEGSDLLRNSIEARAMILILHSLRFCYLHPQNTASRREIAREIQAMKHWEFFREAIWSGRNPCLSGKQAVFKRFLRLPWVWPLWMLYALNEAFKEEV